MACKPEHALVLQSIAAGEVAYPQSAFMLRLFEELFDLGLVNICPPGHRYRLNDAGRAELGAKLSDSR